MGLDGGAAGIAAGAAAAIAAGAAYDGATSAITGKREGKNFHYASVHILLCTFTPEGDYLLPPSPSPLRNQLPW